MSETLEKLDAANWRRFSGLLDQGLALPPSQRPAWLNSLPQEHAGLRGLLQSALQADLELQASAATGVPSLRVEQPEPYLFESGRRFGSYQITAPLGRGGMGEVWRAHRWDDPSLREIALKLPHTWLLGPAMRLRLGREKQILAGLDHPNIVRLQDAGIAEDGQPWMALECVDGQRIDDYCRERRLGIAARLALFDQVLSAVQSAHVGLVVHRDLKPSNILVTPEGVVKLLDFGIAKLLDDSGVGAETELTRIGGRSATPDYAAPEQLGGGALTVATDLYTLGLVLYELLCGMKPFASQRRAREGYAEAPPLASTQAVPAAVAASIGGLTPAQLRRALRGDLDAILAQAMEPNPRARYRSAESFAEDLARHRRSEPIRARHITVFERARKFGRRHRLLLAVGALFLIVVAGGVGASQIEARRAEREAQRANASRDFLLDILSASDRLSAVQHEPGSVTARELLDNIVAKLDSRLADQPETRLELLKKAAWIYRAWFQRDETERLQRRYRQLVQQLSGPGDPRLIQSLLDEASTDMDYPDRRGAAALLDQAAKAIREYGLQGSALEAKWLLESARYEVPEIGYSEDVIARLHQAITIYERLDPPQADLPWTYAHLSNSLVQAGRIDEAYALTKQALEREQQVTASRNDWFIASQWVRLGHIERLMGNMDKALANYERGDALVLQTYGREIYTHWDACLWRATLLDWKGDSAQAEQLFSSGLAELDAIKSPQLVEAGGWFRLAYAKFLIAHRRHAEALPLLQQALQVNYSFRPAKVRRADVMLYLGQVYEALGRIAEARQQFMAANEDYQRLNQPQARQSLAARFALADFVYRHGDRAAAEPEFAEIVRLSAVRPTLVAAQARMRLAQIAGEKGDAAQARALAAVALQQLQQVRALYDPRMKQELLAQAARL
ncbi:protein kinase domain-containing protein [Hydrocarboniphaga sp.]|uniref:protein kinase domain-containing protein n=1 Tax=Hydrocarboniphaga sp. TaxID=2033016 RepID=UPI003D114F56